MALCMLLLYCQLQKALSKWLAQDIALLQKPVFLPIALIFLPLQCFFFFSFFGFFCHFLSHSRSIWRFPGQVGVKPQPQLLAYARATATQDPSHVCNVHHSSRQHRILNPLGKARDRTHNLMVPSGFVNHCAMMGTPATAILKCDCVMNQINSLSSDYITLKSYMRDIPNH